MRRKKIFSKIIIHLAAGVSSFLVSHLTREVTHIIRLSLTRKHERQLGGLYLHRFTYLSFSTTVKFHLAGIFKFFLAVSKEWQILGFFFLVTVLTKQFQLENHRRKTKLVRLTTLSYYLTSILANNFSSFDIIIVSITINDS